MNILRRIVLVAGAAGLVAGLLLAIAHSVITVPLILEAETFETAGAGGTALGHAHDAGARADTHETAAWAPEDGLQRLSLTVLADIVTAIGFALLLIPALLLSGREVDWREGLRWGLAGFVTFTLAPGLGLPPELPGAEGAPLMARQAWWLATVGATAGGLALLFLTRQPICAAAGLVLMVAPHVYGAPQPEVHLSTAPELLTHRFETAVHLVSLVFWATLGAVSGLLLHRLGRGLGIGQARNVLGRTAA